MLFLLQQCPYNNLRLNRSTIQEQGRRPLQNKVLTWFRTRTRHVFGSSGSRIIERGFQESRVHQRAKNFRDHAHSMSNHAYFCSFTHAQMLLLIILNTWQLHTPWVHLIKDWTSFSVWIRLRVSSVCWQLLYSYPGNSGPSFYITITLISYATINA